jgi:uncharacterized lipoprotein YbaY
MLLRPLIPLCWLALLSACSNSDVAPPAAQALPTLRSAPANSPLPSSQREVSGQLVGVPLHGHVEVAVLLVDQRDRPLQTLASTTLEGNGAALAFNLRFTPTPLAPGMRTELRARVSQAGVLTLHLPPRQINPDASIALGALSLVSAP